MLNLANTTNFIKNSGCKCEIGTWTCTRACVFSKTYAVKSFFVELISGLILPRAAGTSWTRQEEEQTPMIDLHPLQTLTF